MDHVRVLVLTTSGSLSVGASIRARFANVAVVEVTNTTALGYALVDYVYDVVCIQYPLPWLPARALIQILRSWFPKHPLVLFSLHNEARVLEDLANIAGIELERVV